MRLWHINAACAVFSAFVAVAGGLRGEMDTWAINLAAAVINVAIVRWHLRRTA